MRFKLRPEWIKEGCSSYTIVSGDGPNIRELPITIDAEGYFELDKYPTGMLISAFATSALPKPR